MEIEELKFKVAPCGISCYNCFAFKDGQIKEYAKNIKKQLGNFDVYAQRFSKLLDGSDRNFG